MQQIGSLWQGNLPHSPSSLKLGPCPPRNSASTSLMNSSWSKVEMVCRPRMALLSVEGAPTLLKLQAATFTTLNSTSAMAAATACPPLGWASQEQDERVILCDQRGCANPKSRQYKSKYAYNPGIIRSSATFRSVPWTIDSWKKYTRTKLSVINDSIHTYCAWKGGCF